MNKRLAFIAVGALFAAFLGVSIVGERQNDAIVKDYLSNKAEKKDVNQKDDIDIGKQLARDMATGEIILMASCLGKEKAIPRSEVGNYIAAAAEKQGISRQELFDNWDRYWGYAKEAEKRNRTSCLG